MDIASSAPNNLKIRPTRNDKKILISQAINASVGKSYNLIYYKASGFLGLLNRATSARSKKCINRSSYCNINGRKNIRPISARVICFSSAIFFS